MKAEELRIGNFITECGIDYDSGDNKRRDREGDEVITVSGKFLAEFSENDPHYEPIPLTEEWLFKFGFEKYEHGFKEYWQLNDFQLEIHGDKFVFRVHGGESAPHLTQFFAHHTKYVHQLQNLYFTLTGEELTIK